MVGRVVRELHIGMDLRNGKRLSRALAPAALAALGLYLWWHRHELASLAVVSPFHLLLCALSTAGYLAASGLLSYAMLHKLGSRVGIGECLSLSVVTTGVNAVAPMQGGMALRAVYLKQLHGFQYSRFLATLIGSQVLTLFVCSVLAAAAAAWLSLIDLRPGLGPLLAVAATCLAMSVLACCLPRISATGSWVLDRAAAISDGWWALRSQPRFLAMLTALVGLQVVGQWLSFWTACAAIGIPVGAIASMAVGTLGTLASVLSITPGALGIYEAAVALAGTTVGLAPAQSVAAALVSRAVLLVLLVALAPLSILFLQRQAA